MKKLFLMTIVGVGLVGCLDLDDISSSTSKGSAQKVVNGTIPTGIEEFQIGKLSESQFRNIATQRGYTIEECNDVRCLTQRDRSRVIKLTHPGKNNSTPLQYKYGPKASTYILYHYKIGNRFNAQQITIYFYDDQLVVARIEKPSDLLVSNFEEQYPNFRKRAQTHTQYCTLNGIEDKRVANVTETVWTASGSLTFIKHQKGQRLNSRTCQLIENGENTINMADSKGYWALEKYSGKNRLLGL